MHLILKNEIHRDIHLNVFIASELLLHTTAAFLTLITL